MTAPVCRSNLTPAKTKPRWLTERMLVERCRYQARQAIFEPAVGALLLALSGCLLQPHLSIDQILPWSLLLAACFFLRTLAAARFLGQRGKRETSAVVGVFSLTSGLSGLLIGAGAGLFFPQIDHPTRLTLTILIFAWLAAAVLLHAAFARHALLHGGAVLVQLGVAWGLAPNVPGVLIAIGMLAYGCLLARLSLQLNATLIETMRRRHQVRSLVRRLASDREAALTSGNSSARLLAIASHDLRQPATSLGLLSALLRERSTDPELQPLVHGIERSAATLNELLSGLLDLSRLQSGTVSVHKEWLSVAELFEALRGEFEARAREQGLALIVTSEPCLIHCDRILLSRALRNLLDNALRYTDRGAITLSASRQSGCVLSVTDTGIGIAPENLDCIFDEHVRLSTAGRPATTGLGLGLSIVRRIAVLVGAEVLARSDGKRGSRFELVFQAEQTADPADPRLSLSDRHKQELSHVAGSADHHLATDPTPCPRLLLVDDNREVAFALSRVLANKGWQTCVAHSATEAMRYLSERQVCDALITDCHLGQAEDGITLALAARLLRPGLTCLLVSGDTSPDLQRRATEHRIPLLTKPVSPEALIAALSDTKRPARAANPALLS